MPDQTHIGVLTQILGLIEPLDSRHRRQVLEAVAAFFADSSPSITSPVPVETRSASVHIPFSKKKDTTLREFLRQKRPKSGLDEVVCVAFYFKHYLSLPRFTTDDIDRLGKGIFKTREPSRRFYDAIARGYLTRFSDGSRELTSRGERLVLSLPHAEKNLTKEVHKRPSGGKFREVADLVDVDLFASAKARKP